jgi:tRNA pseudouridine38-40 synthase
MRFFKVTVEYDGTDFSGFQFQIGHRSVQLEIETAITKLTGQEVRVNGAGRTDTGVHALGQVVSFACETRIPLERMALALNSALPPDVSVSAVEEVEERFHARFSAKSRAYVYVIFNRPLPSAMYRRYTMHCPEALDVEAMRLGASYLLGTQDFRAWANDTSEVATTTRHMIRCTVRPVKQFVLVQVEASAFLRGMVRNITGTLIQVGTGRRTPETIAEITESRSRNCAGPSAPARGLCLVRVRYNCN